MKPTSIILPLGLLITNALAVDVTITMAGGTTDLRHLPTTGECIDLFQGTHHAKLHGGDKGTLCVFWLDSGCTGPPVGAISTQSRDSDMVDSANGARCH
ncbi:hypothetical protein P168DRAFT_319333 [Aspergillus campestris IBT 28561]|uniref:Uncharacterized protein n=1 Tax=Aspergillus campestris (strain IBT 28561) TaxID=1392248 RepID=A0A2I1D1X3_ASPC2|nr:uncharacterized protein P168DRAFT_319333 [Aspergillus campestris IBT 28561]PKY03875.1 hypothetical protein P168DRAFT_319333 [Aspergillus campestris IBT 28561]